MKTLRSFIDFLIPALATAVGVVAFAAPFFQTQRPAGGLMRGADMPIWMSLMLGVCLLTLIYEMQRRAANLRLIALLGVLVALNSALRFLEIVAPGPGGFSPVFFLILLVGAVFGGRMGFLMGALTLLVSALVTGGVGPWLPGQMMTAGWVGLSAAACPLLARALARLTRRVPEETWLLAALIVAGALWGLLYGAIMNLWAWPFLTGPADQYWAPGVGPAETFQRYGLYYLVTSLVWDLARSFGNVMMLLLLGRPVLRALTRFKRQFLFTYQPTPTGERP